VEGKISWTLSSEQFFPHSTTPQADDGPDLSEARLLMFIESLTVRIEMRTLREVQVKSFLALRESSSTKLCTGFGGVGSFSTSCSCEY
jgi:hypothetical protein